MAKRAVEHQLEWSDLSVVLAIGRAGSLAGAGRLLRCSHATVYRKIQAIEDRAGVRFFERMPSGYVPTEAGRVTIEVAERIEGEIQTLSRELLGRDAELQGTVRVTAPDGLSTWILPGLLTEFRRVHPDIAIELFTGAATLDLARREADVAVRATRAPPDESLGRKIGRFRFAPYATEAFLQESGGTRLVEQSLALLAGTEDWLVPQVWPNKAAIERQTVLRTNLPMAALEAARAGLGATVMPCYLADRSPDLVRGPFLEHLTLDLWCLTHPALRHTARVKVLMAFLTDALKARASLFDGTSRDDADPRLAA